MSDFGRASLADVLVEAGLLTAGETGRRGLGCAVRRCSLRGAADRPGRQEGQCQGAGGVSAASCRVGLPVRDWRSKGLFYQEAKGRHPRHTDPPPSAQVGGSQRRTRDPGGQR